MSGTGWQEGVSGLGKGVFEQGEKQNVGGLGPGRGRIIGSRACNIPLLGLGTLHGLLIYVPTVTAADLSTTIG